MEIYVHYIPFQRVFNNATLILCSLLDLYAEHIFQSTPDPDAFVMMNIALNAFRHIISRNLSDVYSPYQGGGSFYGCCMERFSHCNDLSIKILQHFVLHTPFDHIINAFHKLKHSIQIRKKRWVFRIRQMTRYGDKWDMFHF